VVHRRASRNSLTRASVLVYGGAPRGTAPIPLKSHRGIVGWVPTFGVRGLPAKLLSAAKGQVRLSGGDPRTYGRLVINAPKRSPVREESPINNLAPEGRSDHFGRT
jgi:hypothetical protein